MVNILLLGLFTCGKLSMFIFAGMKTSANNFSSARKPAVCSAVLFALAIMIPVVSCPLKKLLHSEYIPGSSLPARTNETNTSQRTSNDYNAAANNCYAARNKIFLTNSYSLQRVKVPAGGDLSYTTTRAGFESNYFLNSTHPPAGISVFTHRSELPLFLQHLRLLI